MARSNATPKPSPKAVVVKNEAARLAAHLRLGQSIDSALDSGLIRTTKVAESWLYHPSEVDGDALIDAVMRAANRVLSASLVVPLPVMAGMISSTMEPSCSHRAARALLHAVAASGRLTRLGMLTLENEPYLALTRHSDADEIQRQLDFIRAALDSNGHVRHSDLPQPQTPREGRAWAETLIGHAEFAGWGRLAAGTLHSWTRR